jgi:diaminohydroxyphosphoribosylaminopyrimidine deaminase/5-amino-6-(5-phosphoribosylamino)uracil reductase
VGAVILDSHGEIVGQGVTGPAGDEHAEVVALTDAGPAARGGTAVVTLEPCNHHGRTGPCTAALIAAGVARVVYSIDDPNPVAAGGAASLREAGIEVLDAVESAAVAAGAIAPWLRATATSRPYVTWKFAATLDGRSAAQDGTSRWITGAEARADVHRLRDIVDAVVVGSTTVLIDDPQLTVRGVHGAGPGELTARQPLRVVLDRRHRVPRSARIFEPDAETLVLDTAVPRFALKALFDRGVRHVLLEGGPTLSGAFLEARLIDQVVGYIAPRLLGAGPALVIDAGITTLSEAVTLEVLELVTIGSDIRITARPVWPNGREE